MKKTMNMIVIGLIGVALSACSVDVKSDEPEPIPEQQQDTAVGPYTMAFKSNVYEHKFDIQILQEEGKVEYFTVVGETGTLKIDSFTSSIQGCDAAQSNVGLYWSADGGTTAMIYVKTGSTVSVAPGKRGLLYVAFRGLKGCTRLISSLKVTRADPVPAPAFPANLLGEWRGDNSGGGFTVVMRMTLTRAASGQVDAIYTHNCGAGYEAFSGVVSKSNSASTPQTFSIKLTSITPFEGGCGNVFALDAGDVGRFVNCAGEKSSATATAFRLSCVLNSNPDVLPPSFYEGDMYWIGY